MAKPPPTRKLDQKRNDDGSVGSIHDPDEIKPTFVIRYDGHYYPIWYDDLSAYDARAYRTATGGSISVLLGTFARATGDPDLDTLAALVWLGRRQNGEPDLSFAAVEPEITAAVDFDDLTYEEWKKAIAAGDAEEPDLPEA